jgi:predicted  nucleic acid-binding Zn-ribbon protein
MLQEKGNSLKKLIELQQKDSEIDNLQKKLQSLPEKINLLKDKMEEKNKWLEAQKEQYKNTLVKQKELEMELAQKEASIDKHQAELNEVKSNEAFKALQKEIDLAKKQKDETETLILENMDRCQELAKKQKELEDKCKQEEKQTIASISETENQQKLKEKQINELKTQRESFAKTIDTQILKRYEYIRTQRQGLAVVSVKKHPDGKLACRGCNMLLTAQTELDLAKKNEIVLCDNCQRILFTKEK